MDGAGEEFLARSRFAFNQHGGIRRRDGHDQIQHALEGRAGADDSLKTIGAFRFRGPNWTHSATERLHTLRPK